MGTTTTRSAHILRPKSPRHTRPMVSSRSGLHWNATARQLQASGLREAKVSKLDLARCDMNQALVRTGALLYSSSMSSISVSELKKKLSKQWCRTAKKDDWVITAEGQPVAVLSPVTSELLEPTLSALRSVRALRAQSALQKTAAANGTEKLAMSEIDAEIAAVRRARRR